MMESVSAAILANQRCAFLPEDVAFTRRPILQHIRLLTLGTRKSRIAREGRSDTDVLAMKIEATAIVAQHTSSTPFESDRSVTSHVEILQAIEALDAISQALLAKRLLLQQLTPGYIFRPTRTAESTCTKRASAPLARVCLKITRVEAKTAAMLAYQGSSQLLMPTALV